MPKADQTTEKETKAKFAVEVTENIAENFPEYWDYHVINPQNEKAEAVAVNIVEDLVKKYLQENYPDAKAVIKTDLYSHTLQHEHAIKGTRKAFFFVDTVQKGELVLLNGKGETTADVKVIAPRRGRLVVVTGAERFQLYPTPAAKRFVIAFTF